MGTSALSSVAESKRTEIQDEERVADLSRGEVV